MFWIRRKILKWVDGVDRAEHYRILHKLWCEEGERANIERQCRLDLARMRTEVDEKDRVLRDYKTSLANAAMQLSIRNIEPIERMDRALEYLKSALCESMIPPFAEGKIRRAVDELAKF